MKGGEVHLFRIYEFILRLGAKVVDILHKKWVGGGMVCKQDDLCASNGQRFGDSSADAGSATLETQHATR